MRQESSAPAGQLSPVEQLKRQAAEQAVAYVESGMVVGLGTGSTSAHAIRLLAERLQSGQLRDILGVPTSDPIEENARRLGIPLTNLDSHPVIDLTIDGADEVDPDLNVIKGGGGALLREKIVAQVSRRNVIIVDGSKLTSRLGTRFYVPVEVIAFGWRTQAGFLTALGARVEMRRNADDTPFISDEGNLLLDCHFGPIADSAALAQQLSARAGIVEHGLFLGLASEVIVADGGGIRCLRRDEGMTR